MLCTLHNVSSNAVFVENNRYISRCVLVEFKYPHIQCDIEHYAMTTEIMKQASSGVGAIISLGKAFTERGIKEINQELIPVVKKALGDDILPRVVPSYAMLLWFTLQVGIVLLLY